MPGLLPAVPVSSEADTARLRNGPASDNDRPDRTKPYVRENLIASHGAIRLISPQRGQFRQDFPPRA